MIEENGLNQYNPLEEAYKALNNISLLEKYWDYEDALPIDKDIIEAARNFVSKWPRHVEFPWISPTVNGKISMDWDDDDVSIIIDFESANTISYNIATLKNEKII